MTCRKEMVDELNKLETVQAKGGQGMISRRCAWNALRGQLSFLMCMLLILSGCTLTNKASAPAAKGQSSVTPSSEISFSIANLLEVVSSKALACGDPPLLKAFFSEKSLVLATDRLIYDQAEVNQITAFVNSQGTDLVGPDRNVSSTPPTTLKYITGKAPDGDSDTGTPCSMFLTITNISHETLQIPQMHLRYTNNTEPNTQLYRLINVCSIGQRLQEGDSCPLTGAGPGAGYEVDFPIEKGVTNTIYSAKPESLEVAGGPTGGTGLPAIPTLRPGEAAEFTMSLGVKNYSSGLLISAVPEAVVISSNETQTLTLTQLKMDIAIAAPQNVSCYALQGTTFVQQDPQLQPRSWCV